MKKLFSQPLGKYIVNLAGQLKDAMFLRAIVDASLSSITGKRYSASVKSFLKDFENQITAGITPFTVRKERIHNVKPVMQAANVLGMFLPSLDESKLLLNAIQVCKLYEFQKDEIRGQLAYLEYKQQRIEVDKLIEALNTTSLELKTVNTKGKVSLKLPDRSQLSNGEMDVLNFAVSLVKARMELTKSPSILFIDEVFDYLDDANLLVAQYYLLQMMEQYKEQGKELYVILLTHMDPHLMESYRFKAKHVSYFAGESSGSVKPYMKSLLSNCQRCHQDDKEIYNDISARYLHYSPGTADNPYTIAYLQKKGFPAELRSVDDYRKQCARELQAYLGGQSYDIPMVCCAIRTQVEKMAFDQLKPEDRKSFIEANGVNNKLLYAEEHGAAVPEIDYLLGGVYNPAMHLDGNEHKARILGRKLDKAVIRNMINKACGAQ